MLTQSLAALLLVSGAVAPTPGPNKILAADVQVAWTDTTYQTVRITWTETTPAPNTIKLERDGMDDVQLGVIAESAPNQLVVEARRLVVSNSPIDVARIVVNEPTGEVARSAGFDRYIRAVPDPDLSFTADGSIRWSVPPEPGVDTTPGDPLDVDQPLRYVPRLRLDELPHTVIDCGEVTLPASTVPSGTIANRNKPYDLMLYTVNEWNPNGGLFGGWGHVTASAITLAAPTATAYGTTTTLTGITTGRSIFQQGMPPACLETSGSGSGGTVILQARNTSTSPWYVVGSTVTKDQGKYTFSVRNPGAREYRTVIPSRAQGSLAGYGSTSAVRLVRSTTRVMSAKFITPVITLGTQPQAYLWVDPAGTQKAALQFKNASGVWQGITYKTLYAGRGIATFTFNRLGQTQFRWWVPGSITSTGLTVDPVYSGTFTLTVKS